MFPKQMSEVEQRSRFLRTKLQRPCLDFKCEKLPDGGLALERQRGAEGALRQIRKGIVQFRY